jgi:uncharacterized membrane protein (DUF106 family)
MKSLKLDIKRFQEEMKKHREDPKKFMEIQKKAMDVNMQYMKHSLKPTLITFLPIIIIFAWLNSHMAYHNIDPMEEFQATLHFVEGAAGNVTIEVPDNMQLLSDKMQKIDLGKASWKLKADSGTYVLKFDYKDDTFSKTMLVSNVNGMYEQPMELIKNSKLTFIQINNKEVKPFGEAFNIFGWFPGWIAAYIAYSLIFSLALRKILDLY